MSKKGKTGSLSALFATHLKDEPAPTIDVPKPSFPRPDVVQKALQDLGKTKPATPAKPVASTSSLATSQVPASKSSLSAVVSTLVRAQHGVKSGLEDVPDSQLDARVAAIMRQEAIERQKQWGVGGKGYTELDEPERPALRTNKRFLANMMRNVDDHNAQLLRLEAEAARRRDEDERSAADDERKRLYSRSDRLFGSAIKASTRDERPEKRRKRDSDEERRLEAGPREKERSTSCDDRQRSSEPRRDEADAFLNDLALDKSSRQSDDERSTRSREDRHRSSRSKDELRRRRSSRRRDGDADSDDGHRSRRSHRDCDDERSDRHRERRRHRDDDDQRGDDERSRRDDGDNRRSRRDSDGDKRHSRRDDDDKRRSRHRDDERDERSRSERSSSRRHRDDDEHRSSRRHREGSSERSYRRRRHDSRARSRSPEARRESTAADETPAQPVNGHAAAPAPSKMDKYFEDHYDPRTDVNVDDLTDPKTGFIAAGPSAEWDHMLDLMRVRENDKLLKEQQKRHVAACRLSYVRRGAMFKARELELKSKMRSSKSFIGPQPAVQQPKSNGKDLMSPAYKSGEREWDRGAWRTSLVPLTPTGKETPT